MTNIFEYNDIVGIIVLHIPDLKTLAVLSLLNKRIHKICNINKVKVANRFTSVILVCSDIHEEDYEEYIRINNIEVHDNGDVTSGSKRITHLSYDFESYSVLPFTPIVKQKDWKSLKKNRLKKELRKIGLLPKYRRREFSIKDLREHYRPKKMKHGYHYKWVIDKENSCFMIMSRLLYEFNKLREVVYLTGLQVNNYIPTCYNIYLKS